MLAADKSTLEAELAKQLAGLQQKELHALQRNFHNLATTCAVLIGFGFGGLGLFLDDELTNNWKANRCMGMEMGFDYSDDPVPSHSECVRSILSELIDAYWAMCCALSLSFNFTALFIATVTSITGPSLALRGPEGSMGVALVHMEQQMKRSLRYFGRALTAFSLTIVGFGAQAMASLGFLKGVIIFCIGGWTLYVITYYGTDIGTKFHLAIGRAVRAEFAAAEADVGAVRQEQQSCDTGAGTHNSSSSSAVADVESDIGLKRAHSSDADAAHAQEAFVQARGEHRMHVKPDHCCMRMMLPWTTWQSKRALHSNRRTSQPLWRLDDIAVLPYHQLQMSRDSHGRPLPRQQVATLIGRLQGSELKRADNRVMGASNAAHDDALPSPPEDSVADWLERVARTAVDSFAESRRLDAERTDEPQWWWPFGARAASGVAGRGREWGVQLQETETTAV